MRTPHIAILVTNGVDGCGGGCCLSSSLRQRADGFDVRNIVSLADKARGQVGAVGGVSCLCFVTGRGRMGAVSGGFCRPLPLTKKG